MHQSVHQHYQAEISVLLNRSPALKCTDGSRIWDTAFTSYTLRSQKNDRHKNVIIFKSINTKVTPNCNFMDIFEYLGKSQRVPVVRVYVLSGSAVVGFGTNLTTAEIWK